MTPDQISLVEQIRFMGEAITRLANRSPTLQSMVLTHGVGRDCKRDRWVGIRRGQIKMCYRNAANLTLLDPQRFVYCEGYAMSPALGIVVGTHAWVLDAKNNYAPIDPTWRQTYGSSYLGIPFSPDYLFDQLAQHHTYGLLDAYWARWPVLRLPPADWIHPAAPDIPRDFAIIASDQHAPT